MRFRLLVAYDGARYHGWQIQSVVPTVEGVLTDALEQMTGARRKVQGASRTDAGVHARGQVAAFDYDGEHDPGVFYRGLNRLTPDDIAVLGVERAAAWFHPRHDARGKVYRYSYWPYFHTDPKFAAATAHVPGGLDVDAMRAAASHLVGRHDFSAFRATGCDAASPIRELYHVDVAKLADGRVELCVVGSAFLKYMVRNIAGTLLWVGRGRRTPEWTADVLAGADRRAAGPTAPSGGLVLERIFYPDDPWSQRGGSGGLRSGDR